jgi:hypothetical protein
MNRTVPWMAGLPALALCPAFDIQTGRVAQSSHLPFGLAGPLNISHLPQAVAPAPGVKKRHPLQVLLGSSDFSV